MKKIILPVTVFIGLILSACEKEDGNRSIDINYNPVIIPANFTGEVTNSYFPLVPGKVFIFTAQTEDGIETVVITILEDIKIVAGVNCTVVHDVVSLEGKMIEDTYDWYAQDLEGNVWYFGEDVSNYENGVFKDKRFL